MEKKPVCFIINEAAEQVIECNVINNQNGYAIAEGILQQGEKQNRNRRYYATEDLHEQVYSDRVRELVTTGNFKGEAGHPLDMNLARQQKVDPICEQVWFTKLWMDGPYVKGHFRGTNNALGESFNRDLKDGQKPSFSLRSLGSIKNNGGRSQVTNLRMICYDRVYFPSYDNAYTDHIVTESASDMIVNSLQESLEEHGNSMYVADNTIHPVMNQDVIDIITRESYNFDVICESFGEYYKSITVQGDNIQLIDEDYNVLLVPLEKYVRSKVDEFCAKY